MEAPLVACRRDKVSVLSNGLAATVLPGVGPFRHFRFLAPSTRLNAISEISAIVVGGGSSGAPILAS